MGENNKRAQYISINLSQISANGHNVYQMMMMIDIVNFQNLVFWYENILSGNPAER
jgi:uncharacterized membrane protein